MLAVGAVAEHADPQREPPAEPGAGQEEPAGVVDALEELLAAGAPEEHHCEAGREQFDVLDPRQLGAEVVGEVVLLVERVAERFDAVRVQRQPDAQAAELAGELGIEIGVVGTQVPWSRSCR